MSINTARKQNGLKQLENGSSNFTIRSKIWGRASELCRARKQMIGARKWANRWSSEWASGWASYPVLISRFWTVRNQRGKLRMVTMKTAYDSYDGKRMDKRLLRLSSVIYWATFRGRASGQADCLITQRLNSDGIIKEREGVTRLGHLGQNRHCAEY